MLYFAIIKKKEILAIETIWMDLTDIMLTEMTGRQILYDLTYI